MAKVKPNLKAVESKEPDPEPDIFYDKWALQDKQDHDARPIFQHRLRGARKDQGTNFLMRQRILLHDQETQRRANPISRIERFRSFINRVLDRLK